MKGLDPGWFAALAAGVLGSGGISALWLERMRLKARQPADLQTSLAAFSKVLDDRSAHIMATLSQQNAELIARNCGLEARIEALEKENLACRQENAQNAQRFESLAAYLRRHGVDVPASGLSGSYITIEDGEPTVTETTPPKRG